MTTKEIAQATGKNMTTVQRWIKKMGGEMQSIGVKMQSSSSSHPADFDLDETIAIIGEGMGKNAAEIYRMNAAAQPSTPSVTDPYVLRGMEFVFGAIGRLDERLKTIEDKVDSSALIGYEDTHSTILGFCRDRGITISTIDAIHSGKEAARVSREEGVTIKSVPDARYGHVNAYHKAILNRLFSM